MLTEKEKLDEQTRKIAIINDWRNCVEPKTITIKDIALSTLSNKQLKMILKIQKGFVVVKLSESMYDVFIGNKKYQMGVMGIGNTEKHVLYIKNSNHDPLTIKPIRDDQIFVE